MTLLLILFCIKRFCFVHLGLKINPPEWMRRKKNRRKSSYNVEESFADKEWTPEANEQQARINPYRSIWTASLYFDVEFHMTFLIVQVYTGKSNLPKIMKFHLCRAPSAPIFPLFSYIFKPLLYFLYIGLKLLFSPIFSITLLYFLWNLEIVPCNFVPVTLTFC